MKNSHNSPSTPKVNSLKAKEAHKTTWAHKRAPGENDSESLKPFSLSDKTLPIIWSPALSQSNSFLKNKEADFSYQTIDPQDVSTVSSSLAFEQLINSVAPTDVSVLIEGESGVGKEVLADWIQKKSLRANKPYIKVNISSLSETLIESELFGYEKGAFTGAIQTKKGRFELANGGTLFLDEIGELNIATQVKLLRVLQDQCFERVGGEQTIQTNIRFIFATNQNLLKQIEQGLFRQDLYYRINVVQLTVPPLRQRKEELPSLIECFLEEFNQNSSKKIQSLSLPVMKLFENYFWPGNIRQLRHVLQSACVLAQSPVIELQDLAASSLAPMLWWKSPNSSLELSPFQEWHHQPSALPPNLAYDSDSSPHSNAGGQAPVNVKHPHQSELLSDNPQSFSQENLQRKSLEAMGLWIPLPDTLENIEKKVFQWALAKYKSKTLVAKKLGVSRKTVYRHLSQ